MRGFLRKESSEIRIEFEIGAELPTEKMRVLADYPATARGWKDLLPGLRAAEFFFHFASERRRGQARERSHLHGIVR